jgi:hypothetical protein
VQFVPTTFQSIEHLSSNETGRSRDKYFHLLDVYSNL